MESFLSTPSARRATLRSCARRGASYISIHALREEGDVDNVSVFWGIVDFYPRPPRGGRRLGAAALRSPSPFLSTPSARRATVSCGTTSNGLWAFLSTPSARRATSRHRSRGLHSSQFLSTPSARRATIVPDGRGQVIDDFYPRPPRGGRQPSQWRASSRQDISIHALREEGDDDFADANETPEIFLSTPSARRATAVIVGTDNAHIGNFYPRPPRGGRLRASVGGFFVCLISIHALREEGDCS